MPAPFYHYRARVDGGVDGVIDGDTLDLTADLGFHTTRDIRLRLSGVDTGEIPSELHFLTIDIDDLSDERREAHAAGIAHMEFTQGWVRDALDAEFDWPFHLHTTNSHGSFNRWLGRLHRRDTNESLSVALYEMFGDDVRYDA